MISDGMINGLCGEFSAKTGHEKKEIVRKLLSSPVMNADFTNASVNGKGMQVLVLASPSENAALYIGREKKGGRHSTRSKAGMPVPLLSRRN